MDDNQVLRRSERENKVIPPERWGFENYGLNRYAAIQNQSVEGAIGGDNTLIREENVQIEPQKYAKSKASKANTKISKQRSIREVTYLASALEKEKEIHKLEMMELAKEKEFLKKTLNLEKELKEKQDEISDNSDEEKISEIDHERRKEDVRDWINQVPPFQQAQNIPHFINPNYQRNEPFESTRLNSGAEFQSQMQNDVLIAALKALQTKEIKDLPIFDGENVLEWPNFISEFRKSTAEYKITPNQNLRRLNKAIQGKARTSVQTLLTSPDNIGTIISHLEMSFGRHEWILQHLISELRSLPIMKEEDIHKFQLFYNKLFGAITTIRNMNADNHMDNPELLACLEEKLPPTTKNYWIHYKAELSRRNSKVSISELGDWFKYELDAQFAGLSLKDVMKKPNKATILTINSSQTKKEKWCHKCSGAVRHYLQNCNEFKKMPVDKRREFVKQNNICFMCLIKGHQTKVCRKKESLPKCSKCNRGHADILHIDNPEVQIEEVRCIKTCDVLLKIAMVVIKGPLQTMTVPAFFDDGSTTTMIDDDLATDLGLEGTISPITYRWTNDIVRTDNESRIVNFQVSSVNKNAKFYEVNHVRTGKNLALPFQQFNFKDVLYLHPYLNEEILKNVSDVQPLLLVGSNNASLTVPLKTNQYRLNGLIECKFVDNFRPSVYRNK